MFETMKSQVAWAKAEVVQQKLVNNVYYARKNFQMYKEPKP